MFKSAYKKLITYLYEKLEDYSKPNPELVSSPFTIKIASVMQAATEIFPNCEILLAVYEDKQSCKFISNAECPACAVEKLVYAAQQLNLFHIDTGLRVFEEENKNVTRH